MEQVTKRKVILINKQFQYNLILKFILVNCLILVLFGGFLYMFLNSEIESNLYSAHVTYSNISEMLSPIVLTLSILNIIISSVLISIFVLFASHKIAGPLYRFDQGVREICKRNLNVFLGLRKGDELYEFSDSLKEMVDVIKSDIIRTRELVVEIGELNTGEIKNQQIEEKIKNLTRLIDTYQL